MALDKVWPIITESTRVHAAFAGRMGFSAIPGSRASLSLSGDAAKSRDSSVLASNSGSPSGLLPASAVASSMRAKLLGAEGGPAASFRAAAFCAWIARGDFGESAQLGTPSFLRIQKVRFRCTTPYLSSVAELRAVRTHRLERAGGARPRAARSTWSSRVRTISRALLKHRERIYRADCGSAVHFDAFKRRFKRGEEPSRLSATAQRADRHARHGFTCGSHYGSSVTPKKRQNSESSRGEKALEVGGGVRVSQALRSLRVRPVLDYP